MPYFSFASFVLGGAVSVTQSPQNLSRDRRFFYCSIDGPMCVLLLLITRLNLSLEFKFKRFHNFYGHIHFRSHWFRQYVQLVKFGKFDAHSLVSIYFHLYRHWWEVRRMASIEFHLLLRLAVFGVYVVIAFM